MSDQTFEWSPWTQQPDLPTIAADGPPCLRCKHWNPQPNYRRTPTGQVPDGVTLCHRDGMYGDFSCFTPPSDSPSSGKPAAK